MLRILTMAAAALLCLSTPSAEAQTLKGYHERVKVTASTRLDWTFVVSNQSLARIPDDFLPGYDPTEQEYALFVPPDYDPKNSYPVVVYLSPGPDGGSAWRNWEPTCKQAKAIFVAPHNAGNNVTTRVRVRQILDVFDEVRRKYNTDPDRTYITGFSGGGRIACAIAFGLPEHFGGVAAFSAAGDLRSEVWLRHRVIDRLSVALATGEGDFNQGEVIRWRGPWLRDLGVTIKIWDLPKLGHAIPSGPTLSEIFKWLETGVAKRRTLAKQFPASRIAGSAAPTRAELAKALLAEGTARLAKKETLYSGLMQLLGCSTRWSDLAEAKEARAVLQKFEQAGDRTWEDEDIAEQRRYLLAQARSLDAYASGPLPMSYEKIRPDMLRRCIELWEKVLQDGKDAAAVKQAKERLPVLQKMLSMSG
jgi:predicted esterase